MPRALYAVAADRHVVAVTSDPSARRRLHVSAPDRCNRKTVAADNVGQNFPVFFVRKFTCHDRFVKLCAFLFPITQFFPTFRTCYSKSHPDVGSLFHLPKSRTNNNIFTQKCQFTSVAHPFTRERRRTIIITFNATVVIN